MKKVLVVEDNSDNMRLITKVLERGGYSVTAAVNGTDGVNAAMKEKFFFIILDINLPDMDGLEVARQIRKTAGGRSIPIIAITSYAMRGDMVRILASGCNSYFEKPIDPLTILNEIHRSIGVKQ